MTFQGRNNLRSALACSDYMKAPPCFDDPETKKTIKAICTEHHIDIELLKDLCEIVNEHTGSSRRVGMPEDIETVIDRFIKNSREV